MKNARIAAAIDAAEATIRNTIRNSPLSDASAKWIRDRSVEMALASDPGIFDEVIGTADAAELVGCAVATISNWKARGHLTPVTPPAGRPAYLVGDVLSCAKDTRRRAEGPSRGQLKVPVWVPLEDDDHLVSAVDAAAEFGLNPGTVRAWAARGYLAPAGLDERNRPLYWARDVARAEHDRRLRAVGRNRLT